MTQADFLSVTCHPVGWTACADICCRTYEESGSFGLFLVQHIFKKSNRRMDNIRRTSGKGGGALIKDSASDWTSAVSPSSSNEGHTTIPSLPAVTWRSPSGSSGPTGWAELHTVGGGRSLDSSKSTGREMPLPSSPSTSEQPPQRPHCSQTISCFLFHGLGRSSTPLSPPEDSALLIGSPVSTVSCTSVQPQHLLPRRRCCILARLWRVA